MFYSSISFLLSNKVISSGKITSYTYGPTFCSIDNLTSAHFVEKWKLELLKDFVGLDRIGMFYKFELHGIWMRQFRIGIGFQTVG